MPAKNISEYIDHAPKEAQPMLRQLRAIIRSTVTDVTEKISYGVPFYEYKYPGYRGRLVYFAAFKNHISIFAWGREVDRHKELLKYKTSKGTLQFPIGSKIPVTVIKKVIRARMKQLDEDFNTKKQIKRPV